MTHADREFVALLAKLLAVKPQPSRNNPARKLPMGTMIEFTSIPLVTVRKIAPNKAVSELQWFLEGESDKCPENLLNWWDGQLNPDGEYLSGYRANLQGQLDYVIEGLRTNPQSRRIVMSSWDAETAPKITEINQNPRTPTPCHLVYVQFDVNARGKLDMLVVQRSGDILLGVPHNWIQHWFLLRYVAHKTGIPAGKYIWTGCNIHLYDEPSHIDCAAQIVHEMIDYGFEYRPEPPYNFEGAWSIGSLHNIEPLSKIKPKLL